MLQIKLSRRNAIGAPVEYSDTTHLFAIIIWCDVNGDGDYVTDVELRTIPIGECSAINEWNFQRFAAKFYLDVAMTADGPQEFAENWTPPEIF